MLNIKNSLAPRALILAAGVSRRLYPLTESQPKCLLPIGGRAIIDHQIDALTAAGVDRIHVVVGYFREQIIAHLRKRYPDVPFAFPINQHFFETNTALSMHLALREMSEGPLILMNGDVLYSPALLERLLASPHENALAVETKPCGDEEVKVITGEDDRIQAIGKHLAPAQSRGEFIGVAKISADFKERLSASLADRMAAGGRNQYFEAAIDPLLSVAQVISCDVTDLPCIEIDFPEDYERACELANRGAIESGDGG